MSSGNGGDDGVPLLSTSTEKFVVIQTADGPQLGTIVKIAVDGIQTLRREDGTEIQVKAQGRPVAVADPSLFAPAPFNSDAFRGEIGIAALIARFRDEPRTSDARLRWAKARGAAEANEGTEYEELVKYRLALEKAQWTATLELLLQQSCAAGAIEPLLSTLDKSAPQEARRIASDIASKEQIQEAIPQLFAAATQKSASDSVRHAIRAFGVLAPALLPLLAGRVHADLAAEVRLAATNALPEAIALAGLDAENASSITESRVEVPSDLRAEVLLHLCLGMPLEEQVQLHRRSETGARARMLLALAYTAGKRIDLEDTRKLGVNSLEGVLRSAMARFALADASDDLPANLSTQAARLIARETDIEELPSILLCLPPQSGERLARVVLANSKGDKVRAFLDAVVEKTPSVATALAPQIRTGLSGGEWTRPTRVAGIRAFSFSRTHHADVAREASRELGQDDEGDADTLARALVINEVPLDLPRVRKAGRCAIARALDVGSHEYATSTLTSLLVDDAESRLELWSAIAKNEFLSTWISDSKQFRDMMILWMPTAVTSGLSPRSQAWYAAILALDASTRWQSWGEDIRTAAFGVIEALDARSAIEILAGVSTALPAGGAERERVVRCTVELALEGDSASLDALVQKLNRDEVQNIVLSVGASFEQQIAERRASVQGQDVTSGSDLAKALAHELSSSVHALGTTDQLGALFARINGDISEALQRDAASDPAVVEHLLAFPTSVAQGEFAPELIALLRQQSSRSRASNLAREYFERRLSMLLEGQTAESLIAFVTSHRRALDRLDTSAIEPLAVALLCKGESATLVWEVLGGGSSADAAASVALKVALSLPPAAKALLDAAAVPLKVLVDVTVRRRHEWHELRDGDSSVPGGVLDIVRRLAPTLDAIDGVILHYLRLRRVLAAHGLEPVEASLARLTVGTELIAGAHRVVGGAAAQGQFEVRSHGLRMRNEGVVLVPANVVQLSGARESS